MDEERTLEVLKDIIRTFWDCGISEGHEEHDIATDIVETAGIDPDELRELGFDEIADAYECDEEEEE